MITYIHPKKKTVRSKEFSDHWPANHLAFSFYGILVLTGLIESIGHPTINSHQANKKVLKMDISNNTVFMSKA